MKNVILTFMAGIMLATSSFAMSPARDIDGLKDYATVETPVINEDTIVILADAVSDWDYFWGTTLNPANTGWNDFWFQCQDPTASVGDCIGTVVVGSVAAAMAPVVIIGGTIVGLGLIPMAGTAVTPVATPFLVTISGSFA